MREKTRRCKQGNGWIEEKFTETVEREWKVIQPHIKTKKRGRYEFLPPKPKNTKGKKEEISTRTRKEEERLEKKARAWKQRNPFFVFLFLGGRGGEEKEEHISRIENLRRCFMGQNWSEKLRGGHRNTFAAWVETSLLLLRKRKHEKWQTHIREKGKRLIQTLFMSPGREGKEEMKEEKVSTWAGRKSLNSWGSSSSEYNRSEKYIRRIRQLACICTRRVSM